MRYTERKELFNVQIFIREVFFHADQFLADPMFSCYGKD